MRATSEMKSIGRTQPGTVLRATRRKNMAQRICTLCSSAKEWKLGSSLRSDDSRDKFCSCGWDEQYPARQARYSYFLRDPCAYDCRFITACVSQQFPRYASKVFIVLAIDFQPLNTRDNRHGRICELNPHFVRAASIHFETTQRRYN